MHLFSLESVPTRDHPPQGEAAWAAWRSTRTWSLAHVCALRDQCVERMLEDNPDLEEIGSSDVSCAAVSFIETGRLRLATTVPAPTTPSTGDVPWTWHD